LPEDGAEQASKTLFFKNQTMDKIQEKEMVSVSQTPLSNPYRVELK
jgi:hypothetical protein